ncbi:MarR family transcriptional regulator [Streptomyces sp. NBC_01260]|uniref:MarR family transcriptional regulator n=1 Tax=Streptomyces sp. NBC_01260 TaxID=2903801 RepID=UPI002E309CB5|nr:MarR family transcriptional regulator [Streptomyces sp. NBC_01260]
MAVEHLSPALPASAVSPPYPMAHPGYGKRTVPDEHPSRAADFALLPFREQYVAAFIERLPEGATMSVKCLAKQIPLYGQQAVSSALTALSVAGHLRRVRCAVGGGDQVRWVFRTYWTRTAHDSEWWANHLAPEPVPAPDPVREPVREAAPEPVREAVPAPRTESPAPAPAPSPAYLALAGIGRADARLALSAADCTALEALAERWFARGVDADYLIGAVTSGLPAHVDSPVGFVRHRLNDKIPPALPTTPTPPPAGTPVRRVMMECTECGTPGRPEALPDGLCQPCRQPEPATTDTQAGPPAERDVTQLVAGLRDLLKAP